MVEQVEALGPELQRRALVDRDRLEERKIEIRHARAAGDVTAGVAELARFGHGVEPAEG